MTQAEYSADRAASQSAARLRQPANDFARAPLGVSIFADRPHVRAEIRDDALAAGLRVGQCGDLAALLEGDAIALGDVVLVDCPQVDAARLAALARLDMRVADAAAQLVVATGVDALDDVFACLDQSGAQILVEASRAERLVALGRAVGRGANLRLRELSEEDRLQLLRLTEQVEAIAKRLDRFGLGLGDTSRAGAPRFESPSPGFRGAGESGTGESGASENMAGESGEERMRRAVRPPLPDPRLVRRIIRQRQLRARFFDGDLFADPAWDMLLDLTAARAEHKRVSVTSLCIASAVPPTTALRWIGQMSDAGLLERVEDEADRRRAFIALTDRAADAIARYFAELGRGAAQLV
ncbi:MAG: winged helix DNA-binding protein [Novosphingobium sp.]|nr:winged helix DNA-binding protein [Novosphingobium sp.]MBO9601430.1 winged helix DNA-binding protein [Novosphingobium sp.]